jgi:endonuclease/exonuclease/phosphatase family metal-dependent hydrolase
MGKEEFSLLTLNTYGVPFFLSTGRIARLASHLDRYPVQVICLQEIQQNAYAGVISQRLKAFPHRAIVPYTYAPKGGLGIFSRLPLEDCRFAAYPDRGLRWVVTFADWALYKGILVARLSVQGQTVLVVNTHMNANYTGHWHPKNSLAQVQRRQVGQLIRLVNDLPSQALVIVCGDLNFPPTSFLYEELITQGKLFDPLAGSQETTCRPFRLLPSFWNITLDYMLLRYPAGKSFQAHVDIVEVQDTNQKLAFRRFLTDHKALVLHITI